MDGKSGIFSIVVKTPKSFEYSPSSLIELFAGIGTQYQAFKNIYETKKGGFSVSGNSTDTAETTKKESDSKFSIVTSEEAKQKEDKKKQEEQAKAAQQVQAQIDAATMKTESGTYNDPTKPNEPKKRNGSGEK